MLKFEIRAGSKRKLATPAGVVLADDERDHESQPKKSLVIPAEPGPRNQTVEGPRSRGRLLAHASHYLLGSYEGTVVGHDTDGDDLSRRAEAELLRELHNKPTSSDGNFIIDVSSSTSSSSNKKRGPLLLANIAEEVLQAQGDDDKFKADLSLRPDDLRVTSTAYKEVPVECFGAALLRGMGWQGPTDEELAMERIEVKSETIVPRERRLGLGATAKPPDRVRSEKDIKAKEEWSRKAEERIRSQVLQVGDVVWLKSAEVIGQRARVEAIRCSLNEYMTNYILNCWYCRGVAGLSKIRVSLEETGRMVEVSKSEVVLVTSEELKDKPYSADTTIIETSPAPPQYFGLMREETLQPPQTISLPTNPPPETANSSDKKKAESVHNSALPTHWLRNGVRVRVVSRRLEEGRACLKKATVTEVFERGDKGTLKLDDGGWLENVRAKHLETVLPGIGEAGVVLVGDHKGEIATLISKDKDHGTVSVHLIDEMQVINLSMDHFAAFNPDHR